MNGLSALLVEDEDDHAFLLTRTLAALQHHGTMAVTRLADGVALLEYLGRSTRAPDLILLDLALPGLDGLGVLEKLRRERLLSSVPVVVVSASERPSDIRRAQRLGAGSYLTKPVGAHALERALQDAGVWSGSCDQDA